MLTNKSSILCRVAVKTMCVFVFLGSTGQLAHCASLGKLSVQSSLGQTLRAEIEVFTQAEEFDSLTVGLAPFDVYRQAQVEANSALFSLQFALVQRGDRYFVKITSTKPIDEPFLNVLLDFGSSKGHFVRSYTLLLDPADVSVPVVSGISLSSQADASVKNNVSPNDVNKSSRKSSTQKSAPQAPVAKEKNINTKEAVIDAPPKKKVAAKEVSESKNSITNTTSKDVLILSKANASASAKQAGRVATEEKIATDKAIEDANTRIRDLEKSLNDLQKMMEVQNKILLEQQKINEALRTGSTLAASAVAANAPVALTAKGNVKTAPNNSATQGNLDFFGLIAGIVALLLALGALAVYFYRRTKLTRFVIGDNADVENGTHITEVEKDMPTIDVRATKNNVIPESRPPVAQRSNTATTIKKTPTVDEIDPVAQADLHGTFGNEAQAQGVLQSFLKLQPENYQVRMKLLDMHYRHGDVASFNAVANDFKQLFGNTGDQWDGIASLGKLVDPGNALYQIAVQQQSPVASNATSVPEQKAVNAMPVEKPAVAPKSDDNTLDFYAFKKESLPPSAGNPEQNVAAAAAAKKFEENLEEINFDFLSEPVNKPQSEKDEKKPEDTKESSDKKPE